MGLTLTQIANGVSRRAAFTELRARNESEALAQFVRATLERREGNVFLADFCAFNGRIVRFGLLNGLSQTLLKLTAPGVPDIYQGNETWRFSLVDPDNRAAVDYSVPHGLLASLVEESPAAGTRLARALAGDIFDPRCKLFLHVRALRLRQRDPQLFERGEYLPLRVTGARAAHLCAFARRLEQLFLAKRQSARPIRLADVDGRRYSIRLYDGAVRLFTPFM